MYFFKCMERLFLGLFFSLMFFFPAPTMIYHDVTIANQKLFKWMTKHTPYPEAREEIMKKILYRKASIINANQF